MTLSTALVTDAEVLAAARGDRDAFARIVNATKSLVSSIALAEVRDLEASRDVAQDVYLQVWSDLGKLRSASSFLPFLRQVTRQRARRISTRLRRTAHGPEAARALAAAPEPRRGPGEALLDAERARLVREALDQLPDDAREIVALYYREGHSAAQVAALLGLGEAAVFKRLSRARATLREDLLRKVGEALEASALGGAFVAGVVVALPARAAVAAALGAREAAPSLLSALGQVKAAAAALALLAVVVFAGLRSRALEAGAGAGAGLAAGPAGAGREDRGAQAPQPGTAARAGAGSVGAAEKPTPPVERKAGPGDGAIELQITAQGKPAAGAVVQLYLLGPAPLGESPRAGWRVAASGAAGEDGKVILPAGPGVYLAAARLPGTAAGHLGLRRAAGEQVSRGVIDLRPGLVLTGSVSVRGTGEPVPLARVAVFDMAASEWVPYSAAAPLEERREAVGCSSRRSGQATQ